MTETAAGVEAGARLRAILTAAGILAGLAYWLILEEEALLGTPVALHRFALYATVGFFPMFGLLASALALRAAALRAAVGAGLGAALATWAGTRFATPDGFGATADPTGEALILGPLLAFLLALTPLLAAWRAYAPLFDAAWRALVRGAVALVFLGLFWLVYTLSSELLQLVGVDILRDLVRTNWGGFVLSGGVLGLALAVSAELAGVTDALRSLVIRLLRLLTVPVTAVVAVFLLAALAQGGRIEGFSAATLTLAMAAGSVILAIATLGRDTDEAATAPALIWSLRALGVILPITVAIAVWALAVRIEDYGLSPHRLFGLLTAAVIGVFVLSLSLATVVPFGDWQARARAGLRLSVMATVAALAVWFTPLLDAQALSVKSQMARIEAGAVEPLDYPVGAMARDWGTAGRDAVLALRDRDDLPMAETLRARIDAALSTESDWEAEQQIRAATMGALWAELRTRIAVVPAGATLPDRLDPAADNLPYRVERLHEACPEDRSCVAVIGDFRTDRDGEEALILHLEGNRHQGASLLSQNAGGWDVDWVQIPAVSAFPEDLRARLEAGDYALAPAPVRGLRLGQIEIRPGLPPESGLPEFFKE